MYIIYIDIYIYYIIYIYIGEIVDLHCVPLSNVNTAPFCENYTRLYFDAKHIEQALNRAG